MDQSGTAMIIIKSKQQGTPSLHGVLPAKGKFQIRLLSGILQVFDLQMVIYGHRCA